MSKNLLLYDLLVIIKNLAALVLVAISKNLLLYDLLVMNKAEHVVQSYAAGKAML